MTDWLDSHNKTNNGSVYKIPIDELEDRNDSTSYVIALIMLSTMIVVAYFLFTLKHAFDDTDEYEDELD